MNPVGVTKVFHLEAPFFYFRILNSSLILQSYYKFLIGLEESVSVPPKWDIMRFDRLKPIPLPSLLVVKNGVNI